ncbi:MAG: hypothetical protein ACK4OF_05115 [Aquificaceae bacterium]
MKKIFGSYLRSKLKQMQEVEIRIRCLILNVFNGLGRCDSYAV